MPDITPSVNWIQRMLGLPGIPAAPTPSPDEQSQWDAQIRQQQAQDPHWKQYGRNAIDIRCSA